MLSTSRLFDDAIRSFSSASSVAMRARSTLSRRAISAASSTSPRAISRLRVSWSARMRSAASDALLRDAGGLDGLAGRDLGASTPVAAISRTDLSSLAMRSAWTSLLRDARVSTPREATSRSRSLVRAISRLRVSCSAAMRSRQRLLAGDARRFDRLLSRDLGLFQRARAGDLERAGLLVRSDAVGIDGRHLRDAQLLGRLAARRSRPHRQHASARCRAGGSPPR